MFRIFAMVVLAFVLSGCNGSGGGISNPFPELLDSTGPTGNLTDVDFKKTTAVFDVKGFTNFAIFLRRASTAAGISSGEEPEIECSVSGSVHRCEYEFEYGLKVDPPWKDAMEVGDTVAYQWFVDYMLPEGSDTATVSTPVRTFRIIAPIFCSPEKTCSGGRECVNKAVPIDEAGDVNNRLLCAFVEE